MEYLETKITTPETITRSMVVFYTHTYMCSTHTMQKVLLEALSLWNIPVSLNV